MQKNPKMIQTIYLSLSRMAEARGRSSRQSRSLSISSRQLFVLRRLLQQTVNIYQFLPALFVQEISLVSCYLQQCILYPKLFHRI